MMRLADYVVDQLYRKGVGHFFMVTGRGNLFLSDAIARHEGVVGVCNHHEQASAFASMAYAQKNGQVGACLVSTGCASTNAITGLLCAWQDDVPCVFLSGQNKLAETVNYTGRKIKTFGQQETDIISVVSPLTKYATMLTDPSRVRIELEEALYLAESGRKGPVWIDIPLDVQNMRIDPDRLHSYDPIPKAAPEPDLDEQIRRVADSINSAERPVLLIGSGVRSANALTELESFVLQTNMPVTFAASAVDAYGVKNEMSIGTVGSLGGNRAANFTLQNSDLVLVVGCRLSTTTTGEDYHKFARNAKVIVVDIDREEHCKNTVRVDELVECDAKVFLSKCGKIGLRKTTKDWIGKAKHWKNIFPRCEEKYSQSERVDIYHLGEKLSNALNSDSVVITDSGLTELLIPSTTAFGEKQRCLHPPSQGSMGYALPAAIGAHYAHGSDIIVLVGDGSIMMNIQELLTIAHLRLPIKIFVTNNNMYSVIRNRQEELFRNRTIGTDESNGVGSPDFEGIAKAFRIRYRKIEHSSTLATSLREVINSDGPTLCEISCVENQEYIRNSFCHDQNRRVVRRPLEDQAPFLDRKLFQSEMIVDPIDQ